MVQEKKRENAASSGFPHFSGQSETRLKVTKSAVRIFLVDSSSFGLVMAAFMKFSLCFGPGKVSL